MLQQNLRPARLYITLGGGHRGVLSFLQHLPASQHELPVAVAGISGVWAVHALT